MDVGASVNVDDVAFEVSWVDLPGPEVVVVALASTVFAPELVLVVVAVILIS